MKKDLTDIFWWCAIMGVLACAAAVFGAFLHAV